jgi:cytochrome c551/c552
VFSAFTVSASKNPVPAKGVTMPENVEAIVKNSCFGCHNTDSQNDKGKEALDFKTLNELPKNKKIHALREIGKVLEDNEMPPEKFLNKYPEKKLSDADKKVLMDWAAAEAKAQMK